jgi:hypothetical protein
MTKLNVIQEGAMSVSRHIAGFVIATAVLLTAALPAHAESLVNPGGMELQRMVAMAISQWSAQQQVTSSPPSPATSAFLLPPDMTWRDYRKTQIRKIAARG